MGNLGTTTKHLTLINYSPCHQRLKKNRLDQTSCKKAVQVLTLHNPYYKAYTYIAVVLTPLSRDDALGPYGPSVDPPYLAGLVSAVA